MTFETFNLDKIIDNGAILVASSGREYDQTSLSNMTPKEQMAFQHKNIKKRLGLTQYEESIGPGLQDMIEENDIALSKVQTTAAPRKRAVTEIMNDIEADMKLSAREKNLAKRQAKQQAKRRRETGIHGAPPDPADGNSKQERLAQASDSEDALANVVDDPWPLCSFCLRLRENLMDDFWEVRHGAAVGLRAVLRKQCASLGASFDADLGAKRIQNCLFSEDLALRICCVLALDRFADYAANAVVAPVRETCCQVLGLLSRRMQRASVQCLVDAIIRMQTRDQWQVRHASFLALKYILVARKDMLPDLATVLLPAVKAGLQDQDDEVIGSAAAAMVPVCRSLYEFNTGRLEMWVVADICWLLLPRLDDWCAATEPVIRLLSELHHTCQAIAEYTSKQNVDWSEMLPQLLKFFRHRASDVRIAAMQTLESITGHMTSANAELWLSGIVLELYEILFYSLLNETDEKASQAGLRVWTACCHSFGESLLTLVDPRVQSWMFLVATPAGSAFDQAVLSRAFGQTGLPLSSTMHACRDIATETRLRCCNGLAMLMQRFPTDIVAEYITVFDAMLDSTSGLERQCAALIFGCMTSSDAQKLLSNHLAERMDELCVSIAADQNWAELDQLKGLLNSHFRALETALGNVARFMDQHHSHISEPLASDTVGEVKALELCTKIFDEILRQIESSANGDAQRMVGKLLILREQCAATIGFLADARSQLELSIKVSGAAALVRHGLFPAKLNPMLKALIAGVKKEPAAALQQFAANALAQIMIWCSQANKSKVAAQILKNVASLLHQSERQAVESETKLDEGEDDDDDIAACQIGDRGAKFVLRELCEQCGLKFCDQVPSFGTLVADALRTVQEEIEISDEVTGARFEAGKTALLVWQVVHPSLHHQIRKQLLELLPTVFSCLRAGESPLLRPACACLAAVASVDTNEAMQAIITNVIPMLSHPTAAAIRIGAAYALLEIATALELVILPYVVLMIVPIMGAMSDQCEAVRILGASCFARVVNILPLEAGLPTPPDMPADLIQSRNHEREFVSQLVGGAPPVEYPIPIPIDVKLRPYQQEGVNWLAFLNKFKIHGILCDEMGLGKTLQALCIVGGNTHENRAQLRETVLPNLVVCPGTLVGHWHDEASKYFGKHLQPLEYVGTPANRRQLRAEVPKYSLIIASYDSVRADISEFAKQKFNYCVLDEGHIIRNSKSKTTSAVKQIIAKHRLILSGTPIQNNVLELWSLFDFLMPGFLGTEKSFAANYSKPIVDGRKHKTASETAFFAMESLHRRVLPFILGRRKDAVLKDLPPKIIQDIKCDLSPLQLRLYEKFDNMQAGNGATDRSVVERRQKNALEALQYLRKVVNHPALAVSKTHPDYTAISEDLASQNSSLSDTVHSPKVLALQQLLFDCGIGGADSDSHRSGDGNPAQHRALIFFQLKAFVDLVEHELLAKMPGVSYLRLDGTVPPASRHGIVRRFNADPTIDVLLLTTHVGGLGLNLTGADTVIFMEHDWNPAADLQAMDRAHRLGQKKVVNVYRLISRGTIEEKIMGLQEFKKTLARTVVSNENTSMGTMETGQLLSLFKYEEGSRSADAQGRAQPAVAGAGGLPLAALDQLQEMWSASEYEKEFDLQGFESTLKEHQ
eukprot:SAG31_NODE_1734_length_7416_cov_2.201449_3_plen_1632_part_00